MAQISSNLFKIEIKAIPKQQPGLPDWVPPAGFFSDVPMTNMPADLTPAIYAGDSYAMRGPFDIWGGSAILRDFSPLGAQVYYSGGHENSPAQIQVGFSLVCDFSSLSWSVRNVPSKANPANTFDPDGNAPDGQPYCFHTYQGLQEMPASWGGGPQGTLVAMFHDTATGKDITCMDVSKTTLGYSHPPINQFQNALTNRVRFSATQAGGTFPATVRDEARQGWWAACSGTVDYTLFIHKSGRVTQYPALNGNMQDGTLILCDSLNLLIAVDGGYDSGDYYNISHRRLYIYDIAAGGPFTYNQTEGVVPVATAGYDNDGKNNYHAPNTLGLQWVEELGCAVGLDCQTTPPTIVKLTPPATDPKVNLWKWSTVPLAHWPTDSGGQAELQKPVNSAWSKFRWVPTLKAFVYGSAHDRRPQVIKLF